jgi:hypothetical protein
VEIPAKAGAATPYLGQGQTPTLTNEVYL